MKKILLPAFVFCAGFLAAQEEMDRPFVWGAMLGFETQLLGIESVQTDPEGIWAEAGKPGHGGSVGIFGRWRVYRGLSVRPALSFSTLQSKIIFHPEGSEYFRFSDVEMPFHFVLTSSPDERFPVRGSLLFGGRIGWNFATQRSENLSFLRERLALDAGMGLEIRLKNWRLQPEFVYSHCLNNIHDVTNAKYDWAVGRVVRDRLTLRVLVWKG